MASEGVSGTVSGKTGELVGCVSGSCDSGQRCVSVQLVQQKRWVFPNRGFLMQLINLDYTLQRERRD
ncbi:unnamed protein product [Coregonus sp. 'balchen']|nr:unnamed protein product [Coregonus sp. 'balchen']